MKYRPRSMLSTTQRLWQRRLSTAAVSRWQGRLPHSVIAMAAQINTQKLRNGHIDETIGEWEKISSIMGKLSDGHLWIDDTAALDIDVMRSRARRLHAQEGLDLTIVDYLQLMQATIGGK